MNDTTEPCVYVRVVPAVGPAYDLLNKIISFSYKDDEKKTDELSLVLENNDLGLLETPIIDKTTVLEVTWGYPGNMVPTRSAIVQTAKGKSPLTITAQDKGTLLNKKGSTRTFDNVKRSDVARRIAKEQGFTDARIIVQDTAVVFEHISQGGMTDAQFVKKLADKEGFEFYVSWDGFHWHERNTAARVIRTYTYVLPPNVGTLIDWDLDTDLLGKSGKTTAKGRDPVQKKDVGATASVAGTSRTKLGATPVITDVSPATSPSATGPTTSTLFDPVTNELVTTVAPAKNTSAGNAGAGADTTKNTTATSDAQAKRETDGAFRRGQLQAVEIKIEVIGDPTLAAKNVIALDGIGKRLSGRYHVSMVEHTIADGGYKCTGKVKTDSTSGGGTGKKPDAGKESGAKVPNPTTAPPRMIAQTGFDPITNEVVTRYVPENTPSKGTP